MSQPIHSQSYSAFWPKASWKYVDVEGWSHRLGSSGGKCGLQYIMPINPPNASMVTYQNIHPNTFMIRSFTIIYLTYRDFWHICCWWWNTIESVSTSMTWAMVDVSNTDRSRGTVPSGIAKIQLGVFLWLVLLEQEWEVSYTILFGYQDHQLF